MLDVNNGMVNVRSILMTVCPAMVGRGKAKGDHAAHQQCQQEFPSRIHGSSSSAGVRYSFLLMCLPQVVLLLDILGQSCSKGLDIVWF